MRLDFSRHLQKEIKALFFLVTLMIMLFTMLIFSMGAYASDDLYTFKNTQQAEQFSRLNNELRCMVCQNQTIADSNASLANDLKNEVYSFVIAGKSDQEIKQYLVERYGDFVLFKPPVKSLTILLWTAPFTMLLLVFVIIFYIVRNQKNKRRTVSS